jgi:hypothetical protein
VAACAFAAEEEKGSVVVFLGVVDEVFADVVAVFVWCWVWIFWSWRDKNRNCQRIRGIRKVIGSKKDTRTQTIANTDDCQLVVIGKEFQINILSLLGLQNPSSAVDVIKYAFRLPGRRLEHAAGYLTALVTGRDRYVFAAFQEDWSW